MYNKILVPLDGSEFSECSLPHMKAIVSGCNVTEVILFRVVEPLSSNTIGALELSRGNFHPRGELPGTSIYDNADYPDHVSEIIGKTRSEATAYISKMVQKMAKENITARGEVGYGKAADEIIDYSEKNNIDLIIMSTHGRGVSHWAIGSVADRVARASTTPVLLVSPASCKIG